MGNSSRRESLPSGGLAPTEERAHIRHEVAAHKGGGEGGEGGEGAAPSPREAVAIEGEVHERRGDAPQSGDRVGAGKVNRPEECGAHAGACGDEGRYGDARGEGDGRRER